MTMTVYYTGVIAHVLSKQPLKYVLKANASKYINKQMYIYPNPPYKQDTTQGQYLCGV